MSDMQYSDKSKLTAKPDQTQQGPDTAPSINLTRVQRMGPMDLQRLVGNKATQDILSRSTSTSIQRTANVTAANDPTEDEADRVADTVMARRNTSIQREGDEELMESRIQREGDEELMESRIQRSESPEAEEEQVMESRIQREGDEELMESRIQRSEDETNADLMGSFNVSDKLQGEIDGLKGSGQPLANVAPDVAQGLQETTGLDYVNNGPEVVTGAAADSVNRQLGARAATIGNTILSSTNDPHTLAHEGAHAGVHQGSVPSLKEQE